MPKGDHVYPLAKVIHEKVNTVTFMNETDRLMVKLDKNSLYVFNQEKFGFTAEDVIYNLLFPHSRVLSISYM